MVTTVICDIFGFDCLHCGAQIYDLWDLGVPLDKGRQLPCRCGAQYLITGRSGNTLFLAPLDEITEDDGVEA